jgi:DMSO/TMAO reductase YedYZ molybdopterin-dependent catalytic subunit
MKHFESVRNAYRIGAARNITMIRDWLIRKKSLLLRALLLSIIVIALFVGITWLGLYAPHRLRPGEISDYNGQQLSAINDFRENSIKGPQTIDINNYTLTVTGLVNATKTYAYDDVVSRHQHYEKVVTLHCVEGWDITILWEGVLVKDMLDEAGADPEAKVVIFYAYDGYSTSLPLDFVVNNEILMAYKINGLTLPPERGFPFELVAESKYGYKWIKWITRIELSDDLNFRGYWESRGFSNDANVP